MDWWQPMAVMQRHIWLLLGYIHGTLWLTRKGGCQTDTYSVSCSAVHGMLRSKPALLQNRKHCSYDALQLNAYNTKWVYLNQLWNLFTCLCAFKHLDGCSSVCHSAMLSGLDGSSGRDSRWCWRRSCTPPDISWSLSEHAFGWKKYSSFQRRLLSVHWR